MTNEELRAALKNRTPVVLRSSRYGELKYKRIYAIKYMLNQESEVVVNLELLDYNKNSIVTVDVSEVFIDNA